MPALNSLVTQQGNAEPPNMQGADGQQPSGLQGLVGQQGSGGNIQPPSHQETVAMLQHMSAFRRRWAQMLKDPEIGTKDMRGDIQDMMADMLADEYGTLPEVMGTLKSVPTSPLEQKQWIEKHIQNDDKAMQIVLQHHAMAPVGGPMGQVTPDNRNALVNQMAGHYKNHGTKMKNSRNIPVNG